MPNRVAVCVGLLLAWFLPGCAKPQNGGPHPAAADSTDGIEPAAAWEPVFIADDRLHNAYRLTDKVISGGVPEEASMQALRELGVKTIVSVDGAQPDVELAKRYGMRYVHLPHGYDGIPESRALELAKAVSELEGPVYVHCHHGKHRSPAAAATACIVAGMISPEQGLAVLKTAGTGEGYRGLYRNVTEARPADRAALDRLQVDYRESVPVTPMAEAMVALEKTHDRLNSLSRNNWKPLEKHADIDAAHEALLLEEHFTELLRTEEVRKQPEEFKRLLRESEGAARALKERLNAEQNAVRPAGNHKGLDEQFARVTLNCKECHQQFRDNPQESRSRAISPASR